ncbi:DUF805 domain-containing protein [Massilia sp. P8910]|uniref:DUF805 domain-containing protein n=1 Tax=Massilia antarctica TaxID=2765360 RepID=UPI001E298A4F|nr:DUF805 domain-containing protein [Massilia antarctica]
MSASGAPACYQPRLFQAAGRIGRVRYMAYSIAPALFYLGVWACGYIHPRLLMVPVNLNFLSRLLTAALLAVIGSRRLRDIGWPWWLAVLLHAPSLLQAYVPMLGALAWLAALLSTALCLIPGSKLANRDGAPPCPNTRLTVAAACLWIVWSGAILWLALALR